MKFKNVKFLISCCSACSEVEQSLVIYQRDEKKRGIPVEENTTWILIASLAPLYLFSISSSQAEELWERLLSVQIEKKWLPQKHCLRG